VQFICINTAIFSVLNFIVKSRFLDIHLKSIYASLVHFYVFIIKSLYYLKVK